MSGKRNTGGRPSTFKPETAQEICDRLSKGEPLAQICRDPGMPHPSTFRVWCDQGKMLGDVTLAIAYARARDDGFDAIASEAMDIIDAAPERVVTVMGEERSESRIDGASVQWAKARAELRLKLLAKWDPKRYGERQLVGSDPDNPLPAGVTVTFKGA